MSLILYTGPTVEPVTLGEVKAHCRAETASEDGLLAAYILAAREHIEQYTRRALCTQVWDFKLHYDWPMRWDTETKQRVIGIDLPLPPFQSVASVTYVDTAGATQTLAADQYQAVSTNWRSREGVIVPAYSVIWPEVRNQMNAITVRFTAGYGGVNAIPHAMRAALMLLVGHMYEHREAVVAGSPMVELPLGVAHLLNPFRVY